MTGYTPHLLLLGFVILFFIWEKFSPKAVERFEDNLLIILMALLTVVSFSQVIARYGFNTGWSGALEFSMVLFSWLILAGMSYGIKRSSHLGVDILLKATPKPIEILTYHSSNSLSLPCSLLDLAGVLHRVAHPSH